MPNLRRVALQPTRHQLDPWTSSRGLRGWESLSTWVAEVIRRIEAPVMVFRRGNRFGIGLTYGRDSQWVQNVLAANGCVRFSGTHD